MADRWQAEALQGQSPDAEPAFDDEGRLRADVPLEPGIVDPPEPPLGDAQRSAEQERERANVSRETSPGPQKVRVEQGPAPTGEEQVERDDEVKINLNLDKIKLRELRGAEIILEIVLGRFFPVLPNLDVLPANVAFALLAGKKLLHDHGVDISRMGLDDAAPYANEIREAWAWAEDVEFGQLGGPMAQPGEGPEPRDPLSAGNGTRPAQTGSVT